MAIFLVETFQMFQENNLRRTMVHQVNLNPSVRLSARRKFLASIREYWSTYNAPSPSLIPFVVIHPTFVRFLVGVNINDFSSKLVVSQSEGLE